MSLTPAMTVMSFAEMLLWILLAVFFWRRNLRSRYPAMAAYLWLHLLATPVLLAVLLYQAQPDHRAAYSAYYYLYWSTHFLSAVLVYFICIEIFCGALSSFPGLMRIGVAIFRWISLAAVIISLSSTPILHTSIQSVSVITFALVRTVSILQLCLLAYLCLNLSALRLSARHMAFGLALGFGLLSAGDFVMSTLITSYASASSALDLVHQVVALLALGVWLVYFLMPEPVHKPVVLPVNSALYRWNEIASALGYTGTQVAVRQPANSFFLSDVEKVVETVLKRTLIPGEPEAENKSGH